MDGSVLFAATVSLVGLGLVAWWASSVIRAAIANLLQAFGLSSKRDNGQSAEAADAVNSDRLARIKARQPSGPLPVTDADRAMVAAAVNSMVAQVKHEDAIDEARGQEPIAVRLVPQVPIRDRQAPRSWLGGRPRLPAGMAWPEGEGATYEFLAQIALEDLPADVWDGLGPRTGWLAFFLHPTNYDVQISHFSELGQPQNPPAPLAEVDGWHAPYGGIRFSSLMKFTRKAFPEWPVDLLTVRPGDTEPEAGAKGLNQKLYDGGYDLADPEHHPFDWDSMLAMVEILETQAEKFWGTEIPSPSPLETQLENARQRLAEAEVADEPPPNIEAVRNHLRYLPELIAASAEARALGVQALEKVREIAARVRDRAAQLPFTPEEARQVMEELRATSWMKVLRKADPDKRPGAELIETRTLPLTKHDKEAGLWAHDYHRVHFDLAKHAYCEDADGLSEAMQAFYEPLWKDLATAKLAGIGHVPFNYVHEFELETDITLLELPSSELMGWMFGDVDNLVLTMTKEDLAAGRFSECKVQVSN